MNTHLRAMLYPSGALPASAIMASRSGASALTRFSYGGARRPTIRAESLALGFMPPGLVCTHETCPGHGWGFFPFVCAIFV